MEEGGREEERREKQEKKKEERRKWGEVCVCVLKGKEGDGQGWSGEADATDRQTQQAGRRCEETGPPPSLSLFSHSPSLPTPPPLSPPVACC
jgi:hypothetical protein